jgi:hypothetical protein
LAADDVTGVFMPVASAWLEAWKRDATLGLYADGLHPSPSGAYLAALVVYGKLLGASPRGLPSTLRLRSGAIVSIPPPTASMLQEAAATVLAQPF